MTFLYGTNMELLYSMPAIGPTITTTTAHTMMTGNSATNPPFLLPALSEYLVSQLPSRQRIDDPSFGWL